MKKAIIKGAKVTKDTVYADIKFIAPAISFSTLLTDPNWGDTVILTGKDSITVKILRIPAKEGKPEVVYVEADCPEREIEKEVPIAVNQNISAGYSLWQLIILAIVCLLVGWGVAQLILVRTR